MNKLKRLGRKSSQSNALLPRDFGSFFEHDDFFVPLRRLTPSFEGSFTPKINVIERKKKLIVEAELPGMTKDDVNVFVEGDLLVIEGERRDETETEEDGVVRKESRFGSFRRAVPIGEGIDPADVKAHFKNGMVRIEMPNKLEKPQPTRAEIPIG